MLRSLTTLITTLLFAFWASPTAGLPNPPILINNMNNPQGALQQPLRDITSTQTYTTTIHATLTHYTTSTVTATRYETTAVPEVVQTWYAGQHTEGCDRTACASSRVWYERGEVDGAW